MKSFFFTRWLNSFTKPCTNLPHRKTLKKVFEKFEYLFDSNFYLFVIMIYDVIQLTFILMVSPELIKNERIKGASYESIGLFLVSSFDLSSRGQSLGWQRHAAPFHPPQLVRCRDWAKIFWIFDALKRVGRRGLSFLNSVSSKSLLNNFIENRACINSEEKLTGRCLSENKPSSSSDSEPAPARGSDFFSSDFLKRVFFWSSFKTSPKSASCHI